MLLTYTQTYFGDMAEQYKIIHPVKYYRDYLEHDIRPDGRELQNFRPVVLNVDSIETADGSAIVKIGNTTVLCGIKAELAPPKPTEPNNGYIVPNIELSPLCSPKFRPGAPSEEAQLHSQCLADIIKNSEVVDLSELCIAKEKLVWSLYCDLVCLDYDGSILNAAAIALIAALKSLKLPKVIYNYETSTFTVDETIYKGVTLKSIPVAESFILFDDNIVIVDPTEEEQKLSNAIITIVLSNSDICYINKPGGCPITPNQMEICMKNAKLKEKFVKVLLDKVFKNNRNKSINLL